MIDRYQVGSILFAGLLVLSLFAMGTAGSIATNDADNRAVDGDGVEIDPTLQQTDEEEVQVLVRLEEYDPSPSEFGALSAETLQSHASATQEPLRTYAGERAGIEVERSFWIANAVLVTVDTSEESVSDLAGIDGVTRLQANTVYEPPNPANAGPITNEQNQSYTYGLEQMDVPTVWNEYGVNGSDVRVAALDTGVDPDHPDINLTEDGWAAFGSGGGMTGEDPNDAQGHGTHVSGTIAGGNASGTAIGVAPGAELLHGKVFFEQDGDLIGTSASILAGMEWAVGSNASVMSMSLGSVVEDESVFDDTYVEPVENAHAEGTVVVASSGNNGPELTGSPGNLYSSFSIAANDENREIASFSSGEWIDTDEAWNATPEYWPDRYLVPDVSGPGVSVLSAQNGGGYTTKSGTSMSAPHVAGQLALLLDANPDLTVDQLEGTVRGTAAHPDGPNTEPGISFGDGIVNATASVDTVLDNSGVSGTVTNSNGEPIERATVSIENGSSDRTDATGEYVVMGDAGDVTVTADAFGYGSSNVDRTLEAGNLSEVDFELERQFDTSLLEGQTAAIGIGDNVTVDLEVANLEEYTLSMADASNVSTDGLTAYINGTEIAFGETHAFDSNVTDTVTVRVETETGVGEGQVVLEHELAGLGESATYTTGPTDLIEDPDPAFFEIQSYDSPRVIQTGEVFTVEAEVKNTGDLPKEESVSHWLIDPFLNTFAEPTQLDPGENATVEWSILFEGLPPGEYPHGVFTETDDGVDRSVLVTSDPGMAVYDFEAPKIASGGDQVAINATVERVGGESERTQDIELNVDGSTVATETVTLGESERQRVSFDHDIPADFEYQNVAIRSENSSASGTIVADSVAEHVAVIDEAQTATDSQQVLEKVEQESVSGVQVPNVPERLPSNTDLEPYSAADLIGVLEGELPDHYVFSHVGTDQLRNELDQGNLSTYDRFVVDNFNGSTELVTDFYNATEGTDQTTVLLDQWGDQSNAIADVSNATGDPASAHDADSIDGARPDVYYNVIRDHQLFDGIAEAGEDVVLHNALYADMAWYEDYSGDTIAAVHSDGDDSVAGAAVGVDDAEREILLASLGFGGSMGSHYYTQDAFDILENAVSYDWEADQNPAHFAVEIDDGATDDSVAEGGVIDVEATVTNDGSATATQEIELRVGGQVVDTATVSDLTPGMTDRVTLSYATDAADAGTLTMEVASADTSDTVDVQVGDGEDREYPVLLGDVTDSGDVSLADVLAVQELSVGMEPGGPIVEERADLDRDGSIGLSDAMLAQERSVGVNDGPVLELGDLTGPDELAPGEDLTATVTIHNAGELGALDEAAVRIAPSGTPLEDGTTVETRVLDMGIGETATLEFAVEASNFDSGEYQYGVSTAHDDATATVTVSE